MFWLFILVVVGTPCGAFVALASFPKTARWAVRLWRVGMLALGWVAASIIRMGVNEPATTEDLQTRLSLVMAIWIMMILIAIAAVVVTAALLRMVRRTRDVGRHALRALLLVPLGALGGWMLGLPGL